MKVVENDIHHGMFWEEFKKLIVNYGFIQAMSNDILIENGQLPSQEYVVYYHVDRGLLLCAESLRGKDYLMRYNIAGQAKVLDDLTVNPDYERVDAQLNKEFVMHETLKGSTWDRVVEGEYTVTFTLSSGTGIELLTFLDNLKESFEPFSVWTHPIGIDLSDYEERGVSSYNAEKNTLEKLLKMPEAVKFITQVTIDKLSRTVLQEESKKEEKPPVVKGRMGVFNRLMGRK